MYIYIIKLLKLQVKVSHVQLFVTPWNIQSMEFSRPEYWSGYPFPSPGYLSNPVIKPRSPALQIDSLPAELQGKPKNTGVGSLSFLQLIFLTQESNQGPLSCIIGGFFTNGAIREAIYIYLYIYVCVYIFHHIYIQLYIVCVYMHACVLSHLSCV